MPDLLHEFWENERREGGHFHPVTEENDRQQPLINPNARLAFSLWASSWFEAMQLYQEQMGYGDFEPDPHSPNTYYTEEDAARQQAYLARRKL